MKPQLNQLTVHLCSKKRLWKIVYSLAIDFDLNTKRNKHKVSAHTVTDSRYVLPSNPTQLPLDLHMDKRKAMYIFIAVNGSLCLYCAISVGVFF
jgi:hypothetical protein